MIVIAPQGQGRYGCLAMASARSTSGLGEARQVLSSYSICSAKWGTLHRTPRQSHPNHPSYARRDTHEQRWTQLPRSLAQSFQSHTWRRKCSTLTFLLFISTIQGCSSMRHGVARRGGSFSRLRISGLAYHLVLGGEEVTYQHSIKYLKLSDQTIPCSGSSLSFGIGCRTI